MNCFSGLMKDKDTYPVLYDFDLMMNGGHIKGYAIEKENADQLESKIAQMQQERDLFLSVGDGTILWLPQRHVGKKSKKD